jgi:hypothetical protein
VVSVSYSQMQAGIDSAASFVSNTAHITYLVPLGWFALILFVSAAVLVFIKKVL